MDKTDIPQESVATRLGCDGRLYNEFVVGALANLKVEDFRKSVIISRNYDKLTAAANRHTVSNGQCFAVTSRRVFRSCRQSPLMHANDIHDAACGRMLRHQGW